MAIFTSDKIDFKIKTVTRARGFPGGSDGKESACNAGEPGSMTGSGRFPQEGTGTHSSILA